MLLSQSAGSCLLAFGGRVREPYPGEGASDLNLGQVEELRQGVCEGHSFCRPVLEVDLVTAFSEPSFLSCSVHLDAQALTYLFHPPSTLPNYLPYTVVRLAEDCSRLAVHRTKTSYKTGETVGSTIHFPSDRVKTTCHLPFFWALAVCPQKLQTRCKRTQP